MTDTTDIKALRELLCHENKESDYRVGVTVTTLRLLLSKADQLEAERQRADTADARIFVLEKGEKYWFEEFKKADAELAALEAKLANPVVLPKYAGDLNHETAFLRGVEATAHKISEAGFTVKEE